MSFKEEGKAMKNIVLTRIDDRLIHGQVMTSWLNFTGANKIMVIDDQVAEDGFMKSVLKNAVPGNIAVGVFGVEKAAARLQKGFEDKDKVIIMVKYPKTIFSLMERGIAFDRLNIGGMGAGTGRSKFYKNISASDEERTIFQNIVKSGCKVGIQIIAEDAEIDLAKLL